MTTKLENTNQSWGKRVWEAVKPIAKGLAWFVGFSLLVSFALAGYDQLDCNGYIPHDRTLDVYMSSDWLVGENRVCGLILRTDAKGKPTGQLDSLICSMDSSEKHLPHNVSVTFKGILDPKDLNGIERPIPDQWRCTRGSDNFTCDAMAAVPAKPPTP